ncbi:MAG: DUF167 domain-containing protein [Thermodesulfobacteriota bacterium]
MITQQEQSLSLVFKIVVQPRASRTEIAGVHAGAFKLRLTAPPVDGAANKMCLKFLSKWLDIPRSAMAIVSGETSRNKTIRIQFADRKSYEAECRRLGTIFSRVSDIHA